MEEMPPFTGGLVGYFSYDYIKYSEPKLKLGEHEDPDFRDMDLMLFDQVIAFDHYRQKVLLITGVMLDDLEKVLSESRKKTSGNGRSDTRWRERGVSFIESWHLRSNHSSQKKNTAVWLKKQKHYIHEGDIFQVVLSNPMRAKAEGSLFDTYRVLRATNPSPYMFYFSSDDIEIAGASPETLVKLEDKKTDYFSTGRNKTERQDKAGRSGTGKRDF